MLVWDLVAAALTATVATIALGAVLGWRKSERRHWLSSGIVIFSLIFAGAWALGVWLLPYDGRPLSGLHWATFAISAVMVGLAVAAVLPQRVLQQSVEQPKPAREIPTGNQAGGMLYWLVMTALAVMIVRHYVT